MGSLSVPNAPVLTPQEAAKLLRVSPATLLRLPVPHLTVGEGRKRPRRRYLRDSVLAWAKAQETAA